MPSPGPSRKRKGGGDPARHAVQARTLAPPFRHPELVSGSIAQQSPSLLMAQWMLKQVQHDGEGAAWPFPDCGHQGALLGSTMRQERTFPEALLVELGTIPPRGMALILAANLVSLMSIRQKWLGKRC